MDIIIDPEVKTVKTDYCWQECIGNDHARQIIRSDFAEDLKTVHDELGIKSVRFHGIFCDDMLTIQNLGETIPVPGAKKIKEVSFRQCGKAYDNVLAAGMKPYVELSFMPDSLAKNGKSRSMHYKNNIHQPKDLQAWALYIEKFIKFLINRYGNQEVESWLFEVWNEPDLFTFFKGKQEDYFNLYKVTAEAIKKVDAKIKVGGPSTSGCKWVKEFQDYCKANNVPYDFVSTHHYPGDGFGNLISFKGIKAMLNTVKKDAKEGKGTAEAVKDLFFHPEITKNLPKGISSVYDDQAKTLCPDKPLYISEWADMAIFGSPTHDEKYAACFSLKTVMDLNNTLAGYSYWCCSDTFEEILQLNGPFVGSYGIITQDGIKKPVFWAFKILSKVYPDRLDLPRRTNATVEYAAFKKGKSLQVLAYAQDMDYLKKEENQVTVKIKGEAKSLSAQFIDDSHCNPKKLWQDLGSPEALSLKETEEIKEKSALKEEKIPFEVKDGETTVNLKLLTNDSVLLTFELK
jgi:xylan 1,4-beta-xylosidase